MNKYPALDDLMQSWFHQDYDLNGSTLEEIIGHYREVTPLEQQKALVRDIRAFLAEASQVDRDFETAFVPQVDATVFAATTQAFLQRIVDLMDG
jgi:hypothetical protein